ncbi:MAG: enoyl-CoA hydratase [Candidatus Tectomicrobia bacterium]|uniref:Enoyl-CoA hydratase n=1 Tax=Tectimicrobiota bacterium TaxID=2528274 RepID=A0A937VXD5_UNCTE|nr:enoyl-CoA hydratase [Candidatus Tectomicrobia bacterium]
MSDLVLCEQQEHIATLTLNRPEKHNAMSPDMLTLCCAHLERLVATAETRVLVIRGQGTRAFTSGYDIGRLPERQGQAPVTQSAGQGLFARFIEHVRTFPAPTIAMIHGYCMGGGLELAATCDLRLAAETGQFRMPPARLGVLYSGEGLLRFVNLIGIAHTCEIFYTACTFDAARAQAMGLLNHVVPGADLETCTYDMARQIASNAPLSVQYTKQLLAFTQSFQDFSQHAETIQRLRDLCMQSDDLQEGRRAFLEKRPPIFQGR